LHSENPINLSPNELPSLPPEKEFISKIFLNERGLRAGWRLLVYAILMVALGIGGGILLQRFLVPEPGILRPGKLMAQELFTFGIVFGAALIMGLLERRSPGVYGLPIASAFGKLFWQGFLIGLIEVSALMALIAAFGGYSFGSIELHGVGILRWGLLWAVFFIVVGLYEEFQFRGYTQFTLGDGIGFWPAAILLSLGFGSVHLFNPGEGYVGAAAVVMIGLLFALALRRTGNLWLVVGWHASFDFGETFLYSVPNSGLVFPGHLSSSSLHGPAWLTGGSVGPEGSIFSFLTMGILFFAVNWLYPAKEKQIPIL
jgi:membrane protease YdiL (CAAX protease family)